MKNFDKTPKEVNPKYWGQNFRPETTGIGIELELEGLRLPHAAPGVWVVHEDNSLRNGVEYVTNGPIAVKDVQARCRELFKFLAEAEAKINLSFRCSTHFHLNVQAMTFQNIMGCFVVYTIIEPLLMRIHGPNRDGNHFCLPAYCTGDLSDFARNYISQISRGRFGAMGRGKYSALNFDPVQILGSIEFRSFPGSEEPEEIAKWAEWIDNIREAAVACKDETYFEFIESAQANPIGFAQTIFTRQPGLLVPDLLVLLDKGCEHAYDVCSVFQSKIKKPETKDQAEFTPEEGEWLPQEDQLRHIRQAEFHAARQFAAAPVPRPRRAE